MIMLTEKSIDNTNKFTSYSQFHSALHCAFQVVDMGDFRSYMKTEIESRHNLAVMFRTMDRNLNHVSTLDAMTEYGMAYIFGYFRSIPRRHRIKRQKLANNIADSLERKDGSFNYSK